MNKALLNKAHEEMQSFKNAWAEKEYKDKGNMRVAVVDNDPLFLKVVENYFSKEQGIDLISFKDELNFIRGLNDQIPDLLILDVNLDYLNGLKVAEILQNVPGAQIPIVFVSASKFEEVDIKRKLNVNNVAYLPKPIKKDTMLGKVKGILAA